MRSLFIWLVTLFLFVSASARESDREQKLSKALNAISSEKNVRRLENATQYQPQDSVDGEELGPAAFMFRSAAYIRLGALGSADAIAAIQRIRYNAQHSLPNSPTLSLTFLDNPARHEGAIALKPMAQATGLDGTQYAIVYAPIMGDVDLFLMTKKSNEPLWIRPRLIPNRIYRGVSEPKLVARSPDELVFTFKQGAPGGRNIMEGFLTPPTQAPAARTTRVAHHHQGDHEGFRRRRPHRH